MSVKQVEQALYDFAVKKSGSAIVLKGEWGTGKTFIWNKVIKEHRASFVRGKYSYVSLFGINSLADLKRTIFESTVETVKAGDISSKDTIINNLTNLDFSDAIKAARKGLGITKELKIPFVGSIGGIVDSFQYAMVSETLVCIDDFERRGTSLTARDVLGLVSSLIESKECSVLLILNEGSLQKDDEFFTYSEKVFDYEVRYSPTLDEASSVVFHSADDYDNKIVKNVKKLKMNNIRLLRKVKYFSSLIKSYLNDVPVEIVNEATLLLPLAIYATYAGADKIVGIADLINYSPSSPVSSTKRTEMSDEKKAEYRKTLEIKNFFNAYGYNEADDFTIAIINLVKNGYANSESLKPLIKSIAEAVERNNKRKKISEAWRIYNHDIRKSDEDLLGIFERVIKDSGDIVSPSEIDVIYNIFIVGGCEERGRTLVDCYFDTITEKGIYKRRKDLFKLPNSPYVAEKLESYFHRINEDLSLDELCEMFNTQTFSVEVVDLMSKFNAGQFHAYFKRLNPDKFVDYANGLLALGSRSGLHEPETIYDIVFKNVFIALRRMHDESPLMALRMDKFMAYKPLYDAKTKNNPAG